MAKLIWIDDEVDLLKPHIVFLESKGYDITPINNVNEALEMIEKENYQLALLDENMPGISGLEAIPMIKNINALIFKVGLHLIMDASLSFDENMVIDSATAIIIDPLLQYKWKCPDQIQPTCEKITTSMLNLSPELYSPINVLFNKNISLLSN